MERIYIDGDMAHFTRRDLTLVDMELYDGRKLEFLEPRRLFPMSGKDKYITLLDSDLNEQAVIRDIATLPEAEREIINSCLEEYYLIPKISQVYSAIDDFHKLVFDVETDRGRRSIEVRNIVHQIKIIQNVRVLFRDQDDNRYEIPDLTRLDKHSRTIVDFYI